MVARTDPPDLQRLRLFVELAADLHFTRSAQRQHVSQPALSQQIKRLERDLGVQLFTRSGRGVALTDAGQALVGPAKELLRHMRQFNLLAGQVKPKPARGSERAAAD